jgi:hypothetical protein
MRNEADDPDLHPGGWWGRLVEWSFQPRVLVTIVLAMLFVVVLPAVSKLWPSISQSPQYRFSPESIDLTEPTEWVPHGIAKQIAEEHPEWKDRSLLEDSLVADLAAEFRKHTWIASVDRVEKTRQGRVKVIVTYRSPVAMVETSQGLVPVDASGVILPPEDVRPSDRERLPRLKGIRTIATGMVGRKWPDPLVTSGAKLCAALLPKGNLDTIWKRYGLYAVVAPDMSAASPEEALQPPVFELLTVRHRRVIWGHPPDVDSHEPSTAKKLERLAGYVKKQSSLDQPPGNLAINIRPLTGVKLITLGTSSLRQTRQDAEPRER